MPVPCRYRTAVVPLPPPFRRARRCHVQCRHQCPCRGRWTCGDAGARLRCRRPSADGGGPLFMVIGRVVLSTREHIIALEARDAEMLGMLLHYPYEVRKPGEYFEGMPEVATPKEL